MAPRRWWETASGLAARLTRRPRGPRTVSAFDAGTAGPTGRLPRRELNRRSRLDLLAALGVPQPEPAHGSVAFLRRRADGIEPGCPACRVADEEARRWFFFYETETNADESLKERLLASGGLCTPHTRSLLEQGPAASWLARSLFDLIVRDLRVHPYGAPKRPWRPCPVCTAVDGQVADLLGLLAAGLVAGGPARDGWTAEGEDWDGGVDEPGAVDVLQAFRSGPGLCVPHARRFVAGAPPAASAVVAAVLADRLATTPELAVEVVTGDDPDAPARARLRASAAPAVLAADAAARRAGLDRRIAALLQRPCCPVCAARETATWRLLDWIRSGRALPVEDDPDGVGSTAVRRLVPALHRGGERPPRLRTANPGMREQLAALCPVHVADLVAGDGGGGWLSEPVASVVRICAARWRDAASAAAETAAAGPGGYTRDRARAVAELMTPRTSCPVCASAGQAAAREVALLHLLGADPARATDIARSHGPCQRCRPEVAGPATGPPGVPWEQAAAARTAELGFELAESLRQGSWTARWDVHGAEMSAWHRAPARLDGAVFGPPVPGGAGGWADADAYRDGATDDGATDDGATDDGATDDDATHGGETHGSSTDGSSTDGGPPARGATAAREVSAPREGTVRGATPARLSR